MNTLSFKRYQPIGLRVWHWLNALVILGLLGTVMLRRTFLSWRANSALIETKAKEAGAMVDANLAMGIAKAMRDVMWEWHIVLGFTLVALIVLRKLVAIATRRFPPKEVIDGIRAVSKSKGSEKKSAIHYTIVKLSYVGFYLCITLMAVTGLLTYYSKELALSKAVSGAIHETHETAMWIIVIFVASHLAGVVLAELTRYRGVVSDMIHGGGKGP